MNPSEIGTVLVSCPDRPGLVAALSQVLFAHGVNILASNQHTDQQTCQFFQRIRFHAGELDRDRLDLHRAIAEVATSLKMTWQVAYEQPLKRVALFVSNTDHCLYDLLLRHRAGELPCEIAVIISNHEKLEPVARQFGIPYHTFPITRATKAGQEAKQLALLEEQSIDLVVLARYMQILSGEFIAHYPDRIINIHHSFLPAFAGGRPYHQARERGVKLVGATAHYATTDLDEGPIIEQDVVRVSHRHSPADLVRKGRDVERNVLSRAVRAHLEDRILVFVNKTVVFD
jgi:formyltetrahydrofolate deformylase